MEHLPTFLECAAHHALRRQDFGRAIDRRKNRQDRREFRGDMVQMHLEPLAVACRLVFTNQTAVSDSGRNRQRQKLPDVLVPHRHLGPPSANYLFF
jgi:hypothetical protein